VIRVDAEMTLVPRSVQVRLSPEIVSVAPPVTTYTKDATSREFAEGEMLAVVYVLTLLTVLVALVNRLVVMATGSPYGTTSIVKTPRAFQVMRNVPLTVE
jgi:hypothetical protein